MKDFEERLRGFALAEPTEGFKQRVLSSIRAKGPNRLHISVWGMAALLLMSISLNIYQLGGASRVSRSVEPSFVETQHRGVRVIQVQSVYVPGGLNRPDVKAKEYF